MQRLKSHSSWESHCAVAKISRMLPASRIAQGTGQQPKRVSRYSNRTTAVRPLPRTIDQWEGRKKRSFKKNIGSQSVSTI